MSQETPPLSSLVSTFAFAATSLLVWGIRQDATVCILADCLIFMVVSMPSHFGLISHVSV